MVIQCWQIWRVNTSRVGLVQSSKLLQQMLQQAAGAAVLLGGPAGHQSYAQPPGYSGRPFSCNHSNSGRPFSCNHSRRMQPLAVSYTRGAAHRTAATIDAHAIYSKLQLKIAHTDEPNAVGCHQGRTTMSTVTNDAFEHSSKLKLIHAHAQTTHLAAVTCHWRHQQSMN